VQQNTRLASLFQLVDDPSSVVQAEVRQALLPYAAEMAARVSEFQLDAPRRQALRQLLAHWRKGRLLTAWAGLPEQPLERVQELFWEYERLWLDDQNLGQQLDELSRQMAEHGPDLQTLPELLFRQRFQGNRDDYYSPCNNSLAQLLHSGRGNPITLSVLLILVGRRLGLNYQGVAFPGHFLVRAADTLLDCFNAGRRLGPELTPELRGRFSQAEIDALLAQPAAESDMVMRILRNFVVAYQRSEQRGLFNLYTLLLKDFAARRSGLGVGLPLREPLYAPGHVVQHRRKEYRGVVVDYQLYQDQDGPAHEPVYRILVHGSPQVATAREEALAPDSGGLVAHPFVSVFFTRFEDGAYWRNNHPWEES